MDGAKQVLVNTYTELVQKKSIEATRLNARQSRIFEIEREKNYMEEQIRHCEIRRSQNQQQHQVQNAMNNPATASTHYLPVRASTDQSSSPGDSVIDDAGRRAKYCTVACFDPYRNHAHAIQSKLQNWQEQVDLIETVFSEVVRSLF